MLVQGSDSEVLIVCGPSALYADTLLVFLDDETELDVRTCTKTHDESLLLDPSERNRNRLVHFTDRRRCGQRCAQRRTSVEVEYIDNNSAIQN